MKQLLLFPAIAICVICGAQDGSKPVTQAEASTVFAKADKVIKAVLHLAKSPAAFPSSGSTATREQIVMRFQAELDIAQSKFKFTPPPLKSAPAVMSFKSEQTKSVAKKLEVLGFVDRFGPLVTSKGEGLSTQEFGDALGYFLARLAELTHTPSSKFSPALMPG